MKEHDFSIKAFRIVEQATHDSIESFTAKNLHAQALGRLGGLKGGKARASKLTPERRKEIAQKAAKARWSKQS